MVQGLFLGLASALTVALLTAHTVGISRLSVGLPMFVVSAAAWAAVVVPGHHRALPRPALTRAGAVTAGIFAVALALRLDPVYFLAQSADMGEYVNRGNVVADGGPFNEWFLQLFSMALALSHLAVGEASAVDLLPFLGMLLIAGLLAVAFELRFGPVVRVLGAAILALHVVPVWFSLLPTSEALYGALLVGLLLFLLLALQRGHRVEAAVAGCFVGLEMVTRGNALLLLPVLIGGLVIGAALVERRLARICMTFVAVATATTYAGFVFNASFSYAYFVPYQLGMYLPTDLALRIGSVGSFGPFLVGLAVTTVLTLAAVAAVEGASRLGAHQTPPAAWFRRLALPGVLLACLLGVAAFGPEPVWQALRNYGLVFGTMATVGMITMFLRVSRTTRAVNAFLAPVVFVCGAFLFLHAYRLRSARSAPTFLYWDRYLFSEVFPMLVIVAFFGLALAVTAYTGIVHRLGERAWMGRAGFALVGLLALVSVGSSTRLLRQERFFGGYYEALAEIDELTGSGDEPLVYQGVEELPDHWFHPNTHRLIALPLAETFNREVLNVARKPFAPDALLTWEEVAEAMREVGSDVAYIVSAEDEQRVDMARSVNPAPPGMRAREVGVVDFSLPVLDEPLDIDEREWRSFEMELVILEVSLVETPQPEV